ncbi:MAG TPA: hypothetical protein VHE99_05145 [Gammaproteobacteria bacterium]|nr:hypothetical protein [Gammaproteobacteria bacterium]
MKQLLFKSLFLLCLIFSLTSYAYIRLENISHTEFEPYTHAEDFRWITGKLKYLGVEGPTWSIIYDPEHNNKFLLLRGEYIFQPPENFKDDEMVVLQGRVKHMEMSSFMSGDYYEVLNIESLDEHNAKAKQELEEINKGKKKK